MLTIQFLKVAAVLLLAGTPVLGTTISVVPVFEALSLQGTDVDGGINEIGEALQATVCSRPMALTGAFPEDLVEAIRTPHSIPSNNPNYQVPEANLAVLCGIRLNAEKTEAGLNVTLAVKDLAIPESVDLTPRQVVSVLLVAVKKTLEAYQEMQSGDLKVKILIDGVTEEHKALKELATEFTVSGGDDSR